jgi:ATP-dependent DNA helicase DinG
MEDAHILVVNHHLYFSDLGLRDDHAAILPPHRIVVFDEAHSLEDVATDHLGAKIGDGAIRHFLDGLWSTRGAGIMAFEPYAFARGAVESAREANAGFWKAVTLLVGDGANDTVRLTSPDAVPDTLSPALDQLGAALATCRERADSDDLKQEFSAQLDRCIELTGALRAILDHTAASSDLIHFAYAPRGRGNPELSAAPLNVGPLLKEKLFARMDSVVLTSATLAADDSERFLFVRRRLGLDGGLAKRLTSPFDYQKQAKLILNSEAIDPNSPRFERAVAAWLAEYLSTAQGGAFVLFTSYRQLQAVHDLVRPVLDRANRFVLRHGDRIGRAQMLDLFKRTGNAILFGTSSFWEGVDVPGDALRHVIITKLPFEVPNHPVVEARHHQIKARGGNPFMERTVPEAIIRLKQGFGRLIRTRNDSGSVAILDHRILTTAYGHYFLRALPPCATEMVRLGANLREPVGQDAAPASDPFPG